MSNIKFNYLYRDAANYKNYSFIVFKNDHGISITQLELLIRSELIDETWFYASQWKLPNLFFSHCDIENDPTWHEFESVEHTNEEPTSPLTIIELIAAIKNTTGLQH